MNFLNLDLPLLSPKHHRVWGTSCRQSPPSRVFDVQLALENDRLFDRLVSTDIGPLFSSVLPAIRGLKTKSRGI